MGHPVGSGRHLGWRSELSEVKAVNEGETTRTVGLNLNITNTATTDWLVES